MPVRELKANEEVIARELNPNEQVLPLEGGTPPTASISLRRDSAPGLISTVGKNLLPPPRDVEETLGRMGDVGMAAGNFALKSALPLAGGMGGAVLGAMTSPVTGLAGPIGGEMIGSALGEYLNQLAGITEQSGQEIFMAGGAPFVGRSLSAVSRLSKAGALKTFGGRQNVASAVGDIMEARLAPPKPAEELYEIAAKANIMVPTPKSALAVYDILTENQLPTRIAKEIRDQVGVFQPIFSQQVKSGDAATMVRHLRTDASKAYKAGDTDIGNAISELRGAILDDVTAAKLPELAAAGNAMRRQIAIDKLTGILHQANPVTAWEKAMTNKSDRLFKGTFSDSEMAEIKSVLNKMSTVTPSGSSGVIGKSLLATAGSMISNSPPVKVIGAVTATFAPEVASRLLTTKWGRGVIEKHLMGKPMDNATMGRVATLMRSEFANDGELKEVASSILKSKHIPIEDKIKAAMVGAQGGGMAEMLNY